jgi:hypothetical protein
MPDTLHDIIQRNYAWFLTQLSALLPEHRGRYALIHEARLVGIFNSPGEAEREGERQFPKAPYSIQPIEDQVVDMGYFSHAIR